jgi:hypothetical protein
MSEARSALWAAAELLGWEGAVLPGLELLGERVCVVASIDEREHQRRRSDGVGALSDPWLLELEEGPSRSADARWRPAPVRLAGVLAPRRTWRPALTAASGFAGFCARAVVLPAREAARQRLLLEAAVCEVGVVARQGDGLSLVRHPAPGPVPAARRGLVHRLVEETVYERLVAGAQER